MRTALDSNILSSLWSHEPSAAAVSKKLNMARIEGGLVISPVAFAELFGHRRMQESDIRRGLDELNIDVDFDLDETVWLEAGRRFGRYADRRRKSSGESPKRMLADFLVGAHALVHADRLITLDMRRYILDFPEVHLLQVGPENPS